jgi:hypothetical protein
MGSRNYRIGRASPVGRRPIYILPMLCQGYNPLGKGPVGTNPKIDGITPIGIATHPDEGVHS